MVRHRLIFGIRDEKLQERLLRENVDKLTLEKALAFCRATEISQEQLQEIRGKSTVVHYVSKQKFKRPSGQASGTIPKFSDSNTRQFDCRNCGYHHGLNECPAYGKVCHKCRGQNHFAKKCPIRANRGKQNVHMIRAREVQWT